MPCTLARQTYATVTSIETKLGDLNSNNKALSDEVDALKQYSRRNCYTVCRPPFPTRRGMEVHRARWCRPGQRPASRQGQLADKAVKRVKRKASAALLPPVVMEGEALESVYQFDYLGGRFTSDGDDAADMRHRMTIAGERSHSLDYLWRDNRLPRSLKPRLHAASVCWTLTHGSEAWMLTPTALATLNGFNSHQLHRITGRSYR